MPTFDASEIRQRFARHGQDHVFAYFDELTQAEQATLIKEAAEIDLDELDRLVHTLLKDDSNASVDLQGIEPAPCLPLPQHGGNTEAWENAGRRGEEALRNGRVAAFVVAGGQGTRLGYEGPKGTFPVTPVREKPLFQLFAEKILAARRRYDCEIHWFIMTSKANHEATVAFFAENNSFGLPEDAIHFFSQGMMPAVTPGGKIILESKASIARSPDGHGGSLRALVRSGAVATMEREGIDTLSYFQVDNPITNVIDPAFIGFHIGEGSEMSSKMIPKAYPEEKVGHFCLDREGRTVVIEYSDLPDELARQRDENGELKFRAGSVAIHVIDRAFIQRVGSGEDERYRLPFHRAEKKIPFYDPDSGQTVKPGEKNGIKFEMFVFDAIPYAKNPIVIEALREDEFSPVKNAEGRDSPRTAREDQLRQYARWMRAAGIGIETDETGLPPFSIEVSPLFATDAISFQRSWEALDPKPEIKDGLVLEP